MSDAESQTDAQENPYDNPQPETLLISLLPLRIRFQLIHLLYAIALTASGLAVFGAGGVFASLIVLAAWTYVFSRPSRPAAFTFVVGLALPLLCCSGLMLRARSPAREAARRAHCANNLKNIQLALGAYHEDYGSFPPAFVTDENGRRMHSWRVLILPYLSQKALYDKVDFGQPWDGLDNRKLAGKIPEEYICPSQGPIDRPPTHTNYVAVVGPHTAWPGEVPRKVTEITDGPGGSLLVVEAMSPGVPWMKPADPTLEGFLNDATAGDPAHLGGHWRQDFFYDDFCGRRLAMADISCELADAGLSRDDWHALLTIDDGKTVMLGSHRRGFPYLRRNNYGNWLRLGAFVLMMLLPIPWVWIGRHARREKV